MNELLITFGLLLNIIGVIIIVASISKMMKKIFGSIGAYSVDWLILEDFWKDAKKYSMIGMALLIIGFVSHIIGILL